MLLGMTGIIFAVEGFSPNSIQPLVVHHLRGLRHESANEP